LKELKGVKRWVKTEPNKELINVHYKTIIKNPMKEIEKISQFLGVPLDKEKMKEAIDPSLYRTKIGE
jgi:hypothetical protein